MQYGEVMTIEDLMREVAKAENRDFRLEKKGDVRLSVDVQDRFVSLW